MTRLVAVAALSPLAGAVLAAMPRGYGVLVPGRADAVRCDTADDAIEFSRALRADGRSGEPVAWIESEPWEVTE